MRIFKKHKIHLKGGRPVKRKRVSALFGIIIVITMLAGLMAPTASGAAVTIEFYNPLAEMEPIDNMPIAPRGPLNAKIAAGEEINLLIMYYGGKPFGANLGIALADLAREEFYKLNPELVGKVSITLTTGGTTLYNQAPNTTELIGTENNSIYYWKNTGPINSETGLREPRPPYFGNPWGPKTGGNFTGFPSYEENFERYAAWASYDAVILSAVD